MKHPEHHGLCCAIEIKASNKPSQEHAGISVRREQIICIFIERSLAAGIAI
jgi:hypothetical protein